MDAQSLGQEDSLEEGMQPTPVFLSGESHGLRTLTCYSPEGCKESDTTKETACTREPQTPFLPPYVISFH